MYSTVRVFMRCVCVVCASLLPQQRKKKKNWWAKSLMRNCFPSYFFLHLSMLIMTFSFCFMNMLSSSSLKGLFQLFLQSEMFSCIFQHYFMHLAPSKFKHGASQLALVVKNLPANARDVRNGAVRSLGREDPLIEGAATHSSILAWRIPRTEKPGEIWSIGSQRLGQA